MGNYNTLSNRNKFKVDLQIAVDIATSGYTQNPYNYDMFKELPPKE